MPLTNVFMAGGCGAFRPAQSQRGTRDVALIFISATREVNERIEGLQLGAVDFANKLFKPRELLARVRTQLERSQLLADLKKQVEQP